MNRASQWPEEMQALRRISLDCGLTEALKWGKPCYQYNDANIVVIQGFKAYCALLFFKGFLMKDPNGILVKTGPNTRVGRQIRFMNVPAIRKVERVLKTYVREAIEVEKSGAKSDPKEKGKLLLPEELMKQFKADPKLKAAFHQLTPGRQRGYAFYFSAAKQSETRLSRIEKCRAQILKCKGINDR